MTKASNLNLPPLQSGRWSYDCLPAGGLEDVLKRANDCSDSEGREWQGIAYTTAGARALRDASSKGLSATDGTPVVLKSVYELRLWALVKDGDAGVLAHELRWLNGWGTAEIVLRCAGDPPTDTTVAAPQPERDTCWYRPNSYLQHGAKAPSDASDASDKMTSVEIFAEDDYGNVVFVDELMTGKWA
ncbi:hypothetical protein [Actinomyces trachealis]|uniref:hypothetical protein n=1 Tax=Actinomyces trachealis TaxID=2763540 RepID=UPI0018928FB5|nr:hypothetical protein [Actinomyces trachealis]